jgi:non-heme chloroperoxidase
MVGQAEASRALERDDMATLIVGSEKGSPIELYYEDVGEGAPVVLVQGWPLSGRSWERQVPTLVEAGHRVVVYDRRGFGRSSQPWVGYDYDTLAADLHALVEHLGLEGATPVGFSMGGGEVARYLGVHGADRVAKAVLVGAVPPALLKTDDNPEGGLDEATIEFLKGAVRGDRLAFLEGFLATFFTAGDRTDLVSEAERTYLLGIAAAASPKGAVDCIDAWGRTDFRADLAAVRVPTLVLHGDPDAVVPFEVSGRRSHDAIAGSELVVIDGAPHGLTVTHADRFNAALLEFLAG